MLTRCHGCKMEVSDQAEKCPHCGIVKPGVNPTAIQTENPITSLRVIVGLALTLSPFLLAVIICAGPQLFRKSPVDWTVHDMAGMVREGMTEKEVLNSVGDPLRTDADNQPPGIKKTLVYRRRGRYFNVFINQQGHVARATVTDD